MTIRHHIPLLIALLLPLMVMRGLLPAGYMASAEDGTLRIVMCSAGLVAPADSSSSEYPAGEDPGNPSVADPGQCLFAHASVPAPPAPLVFFSSVPAPAWRRTLGSFTLPQSTGPPRSAAARAPPTFRA